MSQPMTLVVAPSPGGLRPLIAIVQQAIRLMEALHAQGFTLVGMMGACEAGRPIVRIHPPTGDLVGIIPARRLWHAEFHDYTESYHVGPFMDGWVCWSVITLHLTRGRLH